MSDFYKVVGRQAGIAPTPPATILLITAVTKRFWLWELVIGSINSTTPAGAEITVGRPSTAGTGGAAYTPLNQDSGGPAALATALTATTVWSVEPTQPTTWDMRTGIDVLTTIIWVPPKPLLVNVGGRIGVRIEADNSATKVQWACSALIEE